MPQSIIYQVRAEEGDGSPNEVYLPGTATFTTSSKGVNFYTPLHSKMHS